MLRLVVVAVLSTCVLARLANDDYAEITIRAWCCPFPESTVGQTCRTTACQEAALDALCYAVATCEYCLWVSPTASRQAIAQWACTRSFEAWGYAGRDEQHELTRAAVRYVNTGGCIASGGHKPLRPRDYCK